MSSGPSPIPLPTAFSVPLLADINVPIPPTPLLGRDQELREVAELLDRDYRRVVTLLGPGGVGKTRLALEVIQRVKTEFADGALFVTLDSIQDPRQVPGAVGRALGVQESSGDGFVDLLAGVLAERHLLLVLDNMEHVIGAATWLADTIAHCPLLRVLVTSRRALNIGSEQQYRVAALPVPDDATDQTAAVALFIDRARSCNLDFVPDETTVATVIDICRRLGGLPLAIELAASRVGVLSPQALHARLTHQLALLAGGRGDVPVRLRSMRDAIGWSFDLLAPDEQRLFCRLSVFLGGFTLDAVQFAAAWPHSTPTTVDAFDTVRVLIDQSLLLTVPNADGPRFRMLETIREFGMQASDDGAARMHAEYYMALSESADRALMGPDQVAWLDRLEIEYANLQGALDWLEAHDRLADAVELTAHITFFISIRGHTVDFRQRLERWVVTPALGRTDRVRGLALMALGGLLQNTGDLARSLELLSEAVDVLHDAGDQWFEIKARDSLAETYDFVGDNERMREVAEGTIAMARQLGCHRSVSTNLSHLAMHAQRAGNMVGSRLLKDEAFYVAMENGDTWDLAYHLRDRAAAAWYGSRLEEAETTAEEARILFESLGATGDVPGVWLVLALIAHDRGDLDTASQRIATGSAIARVIGHQSWDVHWLNVVGSVIAARRRNFAGARGALVATLERTDPYLQPLEAAQCLGGFALLAVHAPEMSPRRCASGRRRTGCCMRRASTCSSPERIS